jgi:23S rRNA pseudouridine1911/1915/1917 synthase
MPHSGSFTIIVDQCEAGWRLDTLIASHVNGCSRSFASELIRQGVIGVDGDLKKPGYRVKPGESIVGRIPPPESVVSLRPEPMELHILYEDPCLIVVNKPPGLVVHPAPGHFSGTLVNGLLHHFPSLETIGDRQRPGIVHRLDKDTSGTLVVAKKRAVHKHLADQFKNRRVKKTYLALVKGKVEEEAGEITLPIGRHPIHRKKMSTVTRKGRTAETVWKVRERLEGVTLLEVDLKTGRTHQIRVHCAAVHHPVIGDPIYCRRWRDKRKLSPKRQMLHAWRLGFTHPDNREWMVFEAPIPSDMEALMNALKRDIKNNRDDSQ